MNWPKDRRKAFLWAAKAFGTPYSERTERQKDFTRTGICYAVWKLTNSKTIYIWAHSFSEIADIAAAWWWPIRNDKDWRTVHDKERSDFCSLMAVLSDKDFEDLTN